MKNMKQVQTNETKKENRKRIIIMSTIVVSFIVIALSLFVFLSLTYLKSNCDDRAMNCEDIVGEIKNDYATDRAEKEHIKQLDKEDKARAIEEQGTIEERSGASFVDMLKNPFRWGLDGYNPEEQYYTGTSFPKKKPDVEFYDYRDKRHKERGFDQ